MVTVLLVLGGMLASALGARAMAHSDADKARLAFHLASAEIASTLTLAIQHEEDLIVSASAFISGNPGASAADFDRWAEAVRAMRRYPELQNIGLVKLVPASQLEAFEARLAADPMRPLGPESAGQEGPLEIVPAGNRPYYCLAVAGLAQERRELPARGPGLLRDRADAVQRARQRAWRTTRRSPGATGPRSGSRRPCTAAG